MSYQLQTRRIYEPSSEDDGFRVLVDRLWPRGISREEASIDAWLKDIAPSSELRKWFGHKPERFSEFAMRYTKELASNPALHELRAMLAAHHKVTLLYSARDTDMNQAVVLRRYLMERLSEGEKPLLR